MNDENPTTGDSGASITDRLEKFLSAPEPTNEPKQETQAEQPEKPAEGADPKPESPKDGDPKDGTEPQLTTADLAKILGIDESALDVDEDGSIKVKTKIDGKEGAAKFADLLKTHQLEGHAENRARAAAEREKALQAREQQAEQAFAQKLAHAEQLTNIAAQELMAEYNGIDWKALDQHPDQGAVAALKLKFQERQQRIQNAYQGINANKAQLGQQSQMQQAQRLAQEAERIPTLIPEWKDEAVKVKEGRELIDWGLKQGYDQRAMESLNNSTALDIATFRKAMMYDKLQQSKAVVENKVRTAPKIVKPGQAQTNSKEGRLNDLKQEVRKSGGKGGSVAAWLMAAGKV